MPTVRELFMFTKEVLGPSWPSWQIGVTLLIRELYRDIRRTADIVLRVNIEVDGT